MASSSARYRVTQPLGSPPTLRTGYVRVQVYCNSCRHQADADLRALVLRGQGDVPLSGPRRRTGFREEPLGSVDHVRLLLPAAGADPRSDR
jgi:hypothetical protein